jgi:hypothetical protein
MTTAIHSQLWIHVTSVRRGKEEQVKKKKEGLFAQTFRREKRPGTNTLDGEKAVSPILVASEFFHCWSCPSAIATLKRMQAHVTAVVQGYQTTTRRPAATRLTTRYATTANRRARATMILATLKCT